MSFYTYYQNNSGGSFQVDHASGVSEYVIIEAESPGEADLKANDIGLYFDSSMDCSCCGGRWGAAWEDEAEDEPMIYGEPATFGGNRLGVWITGPDTYIHYADGRITSVTYSREGTATSVYYDSPVDLATNFEEN